MITDLLLPHPLAEAFPARADSIVSFAGAAPLDEPTLVQVQHAGAQERHWH